MNIMPATTTTTSTHPSNQQRPPTHLRLQKQLSFTEAHKAQHNGVGGVGSDRLLTARKSGNGYLRRGLSVDRSLESIRQRLSTQKSTIAYENRNKHVQKPPKAGNERLKIIKGQESIESNRLECVRTGSTTSILKSLDYELKQVNSQLEQRYNCKSVSEPVEVKQNATIVGAESVISKSKSPPPSSEHHQARVSDCMPTQKSDCSKVNLNIVLSHAINFNSANSNESNNSDIESCSESAEPKLPTAPLTCTLNTDFPARANVPTAPVSVPTSTAKGISNVQQRRAQFRNSRNFTINTSTTNPASGVPVASNSTTVNNQNDSALTLTSAQPTAAILNTASSLIVQRRPPLVRAMSAPVRSRSLDENSKGILALQKKSKLRRRKLITRNSSICEKNNALGGGGDGSSGGAGNASAGKNDILFDLNNINGKKQPISRTRSMLAVDVITLVSLVSSEGSDSEKEDSAPETGRGGNAERSRSTGAPSLRKTGKSVSFQENYPPNFQLATKEYSHMIRRGSIVPFAARLRSNRPPTAPPVPIFMTETNTSNTMPASVEENLKATNGNNDPNANVVVVVDDTQSPKDSTDLCCDDKEKEEYNYPQYVRSLKERECWKLYRKMSIKGVSVSYETVLRGMLTPTEFRQIQKQREIEEAKLRALEEENEAALEAPSPTSAMDRLTQKLLKK